MTNMEVKEEVNVVKSDEIATPLLQCYSTRIISTRTCISTFFTK